MRIRLRYSSYPTPGLTIGDTPRPNCPTCDGEGGWSVDYAGPDGDYGGTDEITCTCWESDRHRRICRIPRWVARRWFGYAPWGYSAEPPF